MQQFISVRVTHSYEGEVVRGYGNWPVPKLIREGELVRICEGIWRSIRSWSAIVGRGPDRMGTTEVSWSLITPRLEDGLRLLKRFRKYANDDPMQIKSVGDSNPLPGGFLNGYK